VVAAVEACAVVCDAVVCVDALVEDRAGASAGVERRADDPRRDRLRASAVADAGRALGGCCVVRLTSV
jgi:hypothetical protein